MADSQTSNYQLLKPEPGASRDTWGSKLNIDWDMVDAIMAALTPIGAVVDFAGGTAPIGWLICDGTSYPIATYPKLAAVLGNRYGGDGSTTFAVPDCRSRVTTGTGTTTDDGGTTGTFTLGQKQGRFFAVISKNELPDYALTISSTGGAHTHTGSTDSQGLHSHGGSTDAQGSHTHTFSAVGSVPGAFLSAAGSPAVNVSSGNTGSAGSHAHNVTTTTDGSHTHNVTITSGGTHTHTVSLGGGGLGLATYPTMIALNKIIFAGPPGFTTLSSPIPGAPALMQSPMRGVG